MAYFQVTSSQLKAKAEELRNLNATFKSTTGELEELEATLGSQWEGEAKNAFHQAFTRDKIQMDNFYNAIEQYVNVLLNIAAKYENAESINTQTASTRTY